ncbi:FYVE, RhoGEF and PH domain-containing protein 5 isoform X2 [Ornithorhynchus anatinus]|uniref:FYVE, RhoGEF and PH domain-containing protein 5 isoform X2 n=1 Tax=Ornithorhynchus anatinus TaxID=9258 RepID=UPI0019D4849C|nr:FYVE, RhoGEF and PH domain-containing protein 5 isoform X2 [Ornithorhynchus anatinus]
MNNADLPKPPLAPKPKIAGHLSPVAISKFPSLPRPDILQSPNSMSRGPKPPIAPKPKLAADEGRCSVYMNNNLNKCSNGKLICPDGEIYERNQCNTECSEPEADDEYIVVPGSLLAEEDYKVLAHEQHKCYVENESAAAPEASEEEEKKEEDPSTANEGDDCSAKATEAEEDPLGVPGASKEQAQTVVADGTDRPSQGPLVAREAQDPGFEDPGDVDCEDDPGQKEEENLVKDNNEYNLENKKILNGSEDLKDSVCEDIILTPIAIDEPESNVEKPGDEQQLSNVKDANGEENAEPIALENYDLTHLDVPPAEEEAQVGVDRHVLKATSEMVPEDDEAASTELDPESPERENEVTLAEGVDEDGGYQNIEVKNSEVTDTNLDLREDSQVDEDAMREETADDNCQIIPFENEGSDDLVENSYEFFQTESTSFCSDNYSSFLDSAKDSESELQLDSGARSGAFPQGDCETEDALKENRKVVESEEEVAMSKEHVNREVAGVGSGKEKTQENEGGETLLIPNVVVMSEGVSEDETVERTHTKTYGMGSSLICRADNPLLGDLGHPETGENLAGSYNVKEEINADADNNLLPTDRKSIITRSRSHSGKVPGYVPETVPEETGPEVDLPILNHERAAGEISKNLLPVEGKPLEISRALPAKPRRFILYPRSFSVEGRDIPVSVYREGDGSLLDESRIKRKEDNLSLPCVIGSSGSFSQRSHLPPSSMSTPSSVVDIPPPFELACITKKPITKSSPSLLIENESPDKYTKKKKSSFKRFLALTFKKRTESKVHVDVNVSSSRSSSESSYHGPSRLMDMDRRSLSNSPQLKTRSGKLRASESPSAIIFYKDGKRKATPFSRSVSRVESFEDRSRPPFMPLPLTKPRSISFPNADTSDYENIPAMNSDYENIQIPPRRPTRAGTFTEFFEDPSRALSTANENDGYVDMSSFNAFESKQQASDQETESAYTEPYKVCPVSVIPVEDITSDEEQKSSEEEESCQRDPSLVPKKDGQSRAYIIAQELVSSEKTYVEMLQRLHMVFCGAVLKVLGEENEEEEGVPGTGNLKLGLNELSSIYELHQEILDELEARIQHWEEQPKLTDVFLTRASRFNHHTAYIMQFDKNLALLDENCLKSSQLATTIQEFETSTSGGQSLKHQLLKVVQRIFQYHVLFTDYLNNLCPDSAEYEGTQAALVIVSEVADRANDSMEQGENLQKLVHIEHSVRGQSNLLQPGREFLKEGTLMKVTGKNRHPRHLFLMNDVLLYTYPQKDGKYRLKNTLAVSGMRVSRPVMEKVQYVLKIESAEGCLTLSASSCSERDEWYSCISRALPDDYKIHTLAAFHNSVEIRERLGICLGERPPTLVPVSHVMMCMNCGCDFSLTLRRHHCHACGKIVCRNCSRNKYPLKYLKDRLAKVCDGCYAELKKRGGDVPILLRERPVSMSFPMSSSRFSGSAFSSVFHSIHPSTFKKQKKIPSALLEVAASGEGSAISGYLSRCKKGKRHWKKLWFVIKGKVLYTYMASEDKVATESMPLLGFTISPEKEEGSSEVGPIFHLYHKQTLFYSFKAEDSNSAQRWIEAMEEATVL